MKRFLVVAILLASLTCQADPDHALMYAAATTGMATGGSIGAGLSGGWRAGLGSGIGYLAGNGLGWIMSGGGAVITDDTAEEHGHEVDSFLPSLAGSVLLGAPLGTILGGGGPKDVKLGFVGNMVGWFVGGSAALILGRPLQQPPGSSPRQFSVGSLPDGGGYAAVRFNFGQHRPNYIENCGNPYSLHRILGHTRRAATTNR